MDIYNYVAQDSDWDDGSFSNYMHYMDSYLNVKHVYNNEKLNNIAYWIQERGGTVEDTRTNGVLCTQPKLIGDTNGVLCTRTQFIGDTNNKEVTKSDLDKEVPDVIDELLEVTCMVKNYSWSQRTCEYAYEEVPIMEEDPYSAINSSTPNLEESNSLYGGSSQSETNKNTVVYLNDDSGLQRIINQRHHH